jgi:hypothetical protein
MSSSSDVSSLSTFARPGLVRKSSIEIHVDGHYSSKVYTSGSAISGEVTINPWRDTRFDYLQIILIGTTRTRLDAIQVPQHASHTFLKLSMPIPESAYPIPRIFDANGTYKIPFNFVIPSYLTMSACNHHAQSDIIHDYHMRLPPTMGFWEKDDLAPDMSQVEYAIKARVLREPELEGRPVKLMEAYQHLNVLPASMEDPPLNITKNDSEYALSKSKSLRKNLFSGKIGRFTATTAQPGAVALSPDGRTATGTSAVVSLKFQPSSPEALPPKVNTVSAKLTATTYFSANPMTKLPNLGGAKYDFSNEQRLSYSTNVSIFSTSVDKVTWRQQLDSQVRRDSGYSSDMQEGHSDSDNSGQSGARLTGSSNANKKKKSAPVFHTATLAIPFKLPAAKKMFLPTFHSCLISRVYTLQLTLSVGSSNTNITLALPLQVVVDATHGPSIQDHGLPSFDSVMAAQEEHYADEHLRPRTLMVPAAELQGNSLLPGYEDLAGFRRSSVRA